MRFSLAFNQLFLASVVLCAPVFAKNAATTAPSFFPLQKKVELNYPALPINVVNPNVVRAKPDPRTDVKVQRDWALANVGLFDLSAPAQKVCAAPTVVAVIDTGIDYTHDRLVSNLWVNSGETGVWTAPDSIKAKLNCNDKSCNGLDDDNNGFADDVVGWDFVHGTPLPYDTHGHGTHVAGIVAASGTIPDSNCDTVKVMALKYYDNSGAGYNNLNNTVRAIYYAMNNGAQIINYSGGGHDPAAAERAAIEEAKRRGILFVAAAGNDGHNNDQTAYYPASYPLDNIVGVASVNKTNQLLPSSNFGKTVHIAAPGLGILSTLPENKFGTMSGTSQATAFVTGAAALVATNMRAQGKGFDYQMVRAALLDGVLPLKGNDTRALLANGLLSIPKALSWQRSEIARVPKPNAEVAINPRKK